MDTLYYVLSGVLVLGVLVGIWLMSRIRTAVLGNLLSALCMAAAIVLTLTVNGIVTHVLLWVSMGVSLIVGMLWSRRVTMLQMPQMVALLNGLGGAASALVAIVTLLTDLDPSLAPTTFETATAALALAVGMVTLTGSLIAAAKLHNLMPGKPKTFPGHAAIIAITLLVMAGTMVWIVLSPNWYNITLCTLASGWFGIAFAIRVGGADMPITISLLNSLSGVAGSIAGMAIGDPLLVAVGGVVGASGLLLTQIMCRAMNRSLMEILTGATASPKKAGQKNAPKANIQTNARATQSAEVGTGSESLPDTAPPQGTSAPPAAIQAAAPPEQKAALLLKEAARVIIVPGYGMALAQAQQLVGQLADRLQENGAVVDFAIHPVAGRMPGHMNVLLAEADVPYEKLREMEDINPEFAACDVVVVIGANDVVNPAANTATDTPIYGMPVLNVEEAAHIIICNYDNKPGYAGVDNPLYTSEKSTLLFGDAAKTLKTLLAKLSALDGAEAQNVASVLQNAQDTGAAPGVQNAQTSGNAPGTSTRGSASDAQASPTTPNLPPEQQAAALLKEASRVIIVPGYGMALAQAQQLVGQLADRLQDNGAVVDFAIHPVAGRMPGHMNVLLAEADVPYEKLREMDDINPEFAACDVAVVIGANDVVNPAANTATDTPIYGMPVLNVEEAARMIICNYDDKPGYAGVDNPLYTSEKSILLFGDAAKTIRQMIDKL